MKRAYYYLFYTLFRVFEAGSDDKINDWKAGFIIQCLQTFILISVLTAILASFRIGYLPSNPILFILPVEIALAIVNYYSFLYHNRWRQYEDEFRSYPRKKTVAYRFLVFTLIVLIIGILIFTFYQYSQIDWSQYR